MAGFAQGVSWVCVWRSFENRARNRDITICSLSSPIFLSKIRNLPQKSPKKNRMRRTRDTIIIIMVMWKPHVIFLLNCDLQITIVYLVNCQHLILTKMFDDGFREWFFRQRSEKGVTCKMLFLFFHISLFLWFFCINLQFSKRFEDNNYSKKNTLQSNYNWWAFLCSWLPHKNNNTNTYPIFWHSIFLIWFDLISVCFFVYC